jgi:hypothetical protein
MLQRELQKKRAAEADLHQGRHKQVKSEEGLGEHEQRCAGKNATRKAEGHARLLHHALKQAVQDTGAQAQAGRDVPWTMQAHQQQAPQPQPDLQVLHPVHQRALMEHQMLQQQIAMEQQRLAQQQQLLQQAQLQSHQQLQLPQPLQHFVPQRQEGDTSACQPLAERQHNLPLVVPLSGSITGSTTGSISSCYADI